MANGRVDVILGVKADVTQAKKNLKDLQNNLTNLINNEGNINLADDIRAAQNEASKLKAILSNSTSSLGTLDISKFSQSLKQSGTNLTELRKKLENMGPMGQKVFAQIATAIQTSHMPLRKTNKLIDEMWTSLKNAARWQISSSVLHGFMGALQSAVGYAQDLNKNLNDIRIVSGASAAEMDKFAIKATQSAKALSTTTNEYVKASLIYYQQGLGTKEIEERAKVTVKLANVTGQSMQTVSDQMTAVWNNFDDGTKSLEYYASAMAALGAATASSTDEIAAGLEKFAAVTETIGLSYEYATAALATVTSETRQSADTVGTAFKTLFSRMQGLKLGETLDDGTTLNKYSQALESVGINIKHSNGELKNMDTILDEMGNKWSTLNKDQQVALAQTVGGIRQYNQLIALMDNWDTFKDNLEIAEGAEGALEDQMKDFEEGWQAASNRVRASLENIFNKLIDDDFFVDFLNGLSEALDMVGHIVDAFGGIKGILINIGGMLTTVFSQKIGQGVQELIDNSQFSYRKKEKEAENDRHSANQELQQMASNKGTVGSKIEAEAYRLLGQEQEAYLAREKTLTEVSKKQIDTLRERNALLREGVVSTSEAVTEAENQTKQFKGQLMRDVKTTDGKKEEFREKVSSFERNSIRAGALANINTNLSSKADNIGVQLAGGDLNRSKQAVRELLTEIEKVEQGIKASGLSLEEIYGNEGAAEIIKMKKALEGVDNELKDIAASSDTVETELMQVLSGDNFGNLTTSQDSLQNTQERVQGAANKTKGEISGYANIDPEILNQYEASAQRTGEQLSNLVVINGQYQESQKNVNKEIEEGKNKTATFGEGLSTIIGIVGSLSTAITSVQALGSIWNDDDLSSGEKFIQTLMTLSTLLPVVTTLFSKQSVAQLKLVSSSIKSALGLGVTAAAEKSTIPPSKGATTGFLSAAAGLWSLLWPIGLVIAALALLAVGIMAIVDAFTLEERELKQHEETLNKLKERVNELEEEVKNLKLELEEIDDNFKNFETGLDALGNLTEGTETFNEKLKESNALAEELIEKYDIAASDYYINDQGAIVFTEEAKRKVIDKKQAEIDLQEIKLSEARISVADEEYRFAKNRYNQIKSYAAKRSEKAYQTDKDIHTKMAAEEDEREIKIIRDIAANIEVKSPEEFLNMSTDDFLDEIETQLKKAGHSVDDFKEHLKDTDYLTQLKNSVYELKHTNETLNEVMEEEIDKRLTQLGKKVAGEYAQEISPDDGQRNSVLEYFGTLNFKENSREKYDEGQQKIYDKYSFDGIMTKADQTKYSDYQIDKHIKKIYNSLSKEQKTKLQNKLNKTSEEEVLEALKYEDGVGSKGAAEAFGYLLGLVYKDNADVSYTQGEKDDWSRKNMTYKFKGAPLENFENANIDMIIRDTLDHIKAREIKELENEVKNTTTASTQNYQDIFQKTLQDLDNTMGEGFGNIIGTALQNELNGSNNENLYNAYFDTSKITLAEAKSIKENMDDAMDILSKDSTFNKVYDTKDEQEWFKNEWMNRANLLLQNLPKSGYDVVNEWMNKINLDNIFIDQYGMLQTEYEKVYRQLGEEGLEQFSDIVDNFTLDDKNFQAFYDSIKKFGSDLPITKYEDFIEVLSDNGATVEITEQQYVQLQHSLMSYNQSVQNVLTSIDALTYLQNNVKGFGDTIDKNVWLKLSKNMQGYFVSMEDGSYRLVKAGNDFLDSVEEVKTASIVEILTGAQEQNVLEFSNDVKWTGLKDSENYYGHDATATIDITSLNDQDIMSWYMAYSISDKLDDNQKKAYRNRVNQYRQENNITRDVEFSDENNLMRRVSSYYNNPNASIDGFDQNTIIDSTLSQIELGATPEQMLSQLDYIGKFLNADERYNDQLENFVRQINSDIETYGEVTLLTFRDFLSFNNQVVEDAGGIDVLREQEEQREKLNRQTALSQIQSLEQLELINSMFGEEALTREEKLNVLSNILDKENTERDEARKNAIDDGYKFDEMPETSFQRKRRLGQEEEEDKAYYKESVDAYRVIESTANEKKAALEEFKKQIGDMDPADYEVQLKPLEDEFDKAMEDLMAAEYEIEIAIASDISNEVEDSMSKINEMREAASLIGDDFVVSANKLAYLNSMFPGIVTSLTDMKDGTVKLNQEAVKSAMGTASAEVQAEYDANKEKLGALVIYYKTRAGVYTQMAEAAEKLATGEVTTQEEAAGLLDTIEQGKTKLQTEELENRGIADDEFTADVIENAKTASESEMQGIQDSVNESMIGYSNMVSNSASAARMIILNAVAQAKANAAAANGDIEGAEAELNNIVEPTNGNFVNDVSVKSNIKGYTADTEKTYGENQQEFDYNDWLKQNGYDPNQLKEDAENYRMQAENNDKIASYLEGQMTEFDAEKNNALTSFDNIGKGLGSDGKKDKDKDSGSGSGDKNKPEDYSDQKKNLDEVLERYEKIINELEDIERQVGRINKEADRLWGANRLNALKKVNKELENQKKALETKQQELNDNLWSDQQKAIEVGFTFDEAGRISNKDEMLAAATGEWNATIDYLNSLSTKDAQDAFKETDDYKEAEEKIENLKKIAELYEETRDAFEDNKDAIKDLEYTIQDNTQAQLIEAFEIDKTLNDLGSQIAEAVSIELGGTLNSVVAQLESYQTQIKDKTGRTIYLSSFVDTFFNQTLESNISQADKVSNLQTIISDYLSTYEGLKETLAETIAIYETTFSIGVEELNKVVEKYDVINNKLDFYKNMLGLIGKESDILLQKELNRVSLNTESERYNSAQQYLKILREEEENLTAKLKELENETEGELYKTLVENRENVKNLIQEQEQASLESIENIFTFLQEQLTLNLDEAKKKFSETLSGVEKDSTGRKLYGSLEEMTSQFNRQTEIQDFFLTKTNKMYETSKMIRQAQLAMDKTDNELSKKKYQGYIKLVENLQGQAEVSQEELDIAQARYELLQAQIALEEAQNAKSTVRLTRNAEGNWGYMYTADEDKIADAEQKLEDAENKLYNTGLDAAKSYAEQRVEILNSMYEELAEVQEKAAAGEYETEEERLREIDRIRNFYEKKYEKAENQYNKGVDVLGDFSANNELTFGKNLISSNELSKAIGDYLRDSNTAISSWKEQIQSYGETLGVPLNNLDNSINLLNDEVVNLRGSIEKAVDDMKLALTNVYNFWADETEYKDENGQGITIFDYINSSMDSIYKNIDNAYKILQEEAKTLYAGEDQKQTIVTSNDQASSSSSTPDSEQQSSISQEDTDPDETETPSDTKTDKTGLAQVIPSNVDVTSVNKYMSNENYDSSNGCIAETDFEYWKNKYPNNLWRMVYGVEGGFKGTYNNGAFEKGEYVYVPKKGLFGLCLGYTSDGKRYKVQFPDEENPQTYPRNSSAVLFDTGGYTGQWGPEGKLATLHEKEIVLNKYDTENFLKAIEIVRSISDKIEATATSSALGLLNFGNIANAFSTGNDILQQEVTIRADFPNVQSHSEIEEAFNNLLNTASQYANRK